MPPENSGGEDVMAGDFNTKSREWGMMRSYMRGFSVAEMVVRLDMIIINKGEASTFRRSSGNGTIINITLATLSMAALIQNRRVLQGEGTLREI